MGSVIVREDEENIWSLRREGTERGEEETTEKEVNPMHTWSFNPNTGNGSNPQVSLPGQNLPTQVGRSCANFRSETGRRPRIYQVETISIVVLIATWSVTSFASPIRLAPLMRSPTGRVA